MRVKNTPSSFGLIAIVLHWVMAIIMIGLIIFGLYMTRMPISVKKLAYYGWHKEFGILILMLVIFRWIWRINNQLPTLSELPRWEIIAAHAVHYLFYFFMAALPITGWLITSSADLPVSFFGLFTLPNLISASESHRILFSRIHEWLSYVLIIILLMHTLAALKHWLINKDQIMQRMIWPT